MICPNFQVVLSFTLLFALVSAEAQLLTGGGLVGGLGAGGVGRGGLVGAVHPAVVGGGLVAGRGLVTCCGVGVDHIPSPTASVFIDISFGFIVTAGNERGG